MSAELLLANRHEIRKQNEEGGSLIIKYPELGKGEIEPDTDKLVIIREDDDFATRPVIDNLCRCYPHLNRADVQEIVRSAYGQDMMAHLITQYHQAVPKDKLEVHLFHPDSLEDRVRELAGDSFIVSLDPLVNGTTAHAQYCASRAHVATEKLGHMHRNGHLPLEKQIQRIVKMYPGGRVTLVDDDLFGGGTAVAAAEKFQSHGLRPDQFVFGIRVGVGEKLVSTGVEVGAAMDYSHIDPDKMDLIDLRDFAFGYDGMGILLPQSGSLGRVPSMTPFFKPSLDTLIPDHADEQFSQAMWEANIEHFLRLEEQLKVDVMLAHMNSDAMMYMAEIHGISPDTRMADLSAWILNNHDQLWADTQARAEAFRLQQQAGI